MSWIAQYDDPLDFLSRFFSRTLAIMALGAIQLCSAGRGGSAGEGRERQRIEEAEAFLLGQVPICPSSIIRSLFSSVLDGIVC